MSEKADGKVDAAADAAAGTAAEVERLTNSLRFEKAKNEVLLGEVIALEDEVVNRCMADFDAVVSDETREFWRGQLLTNREMATTALTELARAKQGLAAGNDGASTRRPLHNRAVARPMAPTAVGGGGAGPAAGSAQAAGAADDRAAKIRNRAHEISRAQRVPFSAAFSRAEREISGQ